jgi:hypothetical protein
MVKAVTEHVMAQHLEVERTHDDDSKSWSREMKPKWDAVLRFEPVVAR